MVHIKTSLKHAEASVLRYLSCVVLTLELISQANLFAASGAWSSGVSNLMPAGTYIAAQSWADGQGSHVAPWFGLMANNHVISVSPNPPTPTSFVTYGIVPLPVGATLEDLVCSASGKPVVYEVMTPNITHQIYYYDSGTSSFQPSFIPSPGNPTININGTQQGSYVGMMSNDIHGNITLEILSYFWKSTDDGKTFTLITDTANFIQPPLPNTFPFGSVVTAVPSYANNSPSIQSISGAPYGGSTAPWGEMYVGKEFYNWRSYDDGQTWELIDPLWYQPMRDSTTGLPVYQNFCLSYAMFGKGDGAAFTTDSDVMINAFRVASYVNSGFPKFFRILPSGQIIHATNGDIDPVSSPYITNGYTLSQGSGLGMITTKSGDTFGTIVWNPLPVGNPLNRNPTEVVKWDADTKLWTIITPPAGGKPSPISSYAFIKTAGDGDHYFLNSGPTYQWTPNVGSNLRPDVTLKPGNFPLVVATDPTTHVASTMPGNSFNVSDDHTPAANLLYSWSFRGQGRVTFDNASALNATAYFSNPGFYVLTLTANDGSLSGAMSVTVKVLPPSGGGGSAPSIAVAGQPANQILNVGQPITISLSATGTNLKYQWKRNGMEVVDTLPGSTSYVLQGQTLDYSGTNTNQLTIASGQTIDSGAIYYCEVSNEYGRVTSNCSTIGNPPSIIQSPVDNNMTNGDLSVSTSGTQPFQWQWYSGTPGSGAAIAGARSSMYHTTTAGNYYVVVSNIFGSTTSAPAQIGAIPGNSVTFNLGGANSNGTLASSASFLVGSTIGLGTDAGAYGNWLYFTKWNSSSSHVTIAPGLTNAPQSKFIVDSTASGTVSISTSTTFFTNEFVLTVKNGFGTSSTHQYRFHAGDTVCIKAFAPPQGMTFNGWIVSKGGTLSGGFVANPGNGNSLTKFTFPSGDVEIIATYAGSGPTYSIGGTISSNSIGLSGVSVSLVSNGNVLQAVSTDVNGSYSFIPIPDGSQFTVQASKSGYTFTPNSISGTINAAAVTANFIATMVQPPNITSLQVSPIPVTSTTASVQAIASDPNTPTQTLTYLWTATGPASVTFTPNNSTLANNATATFSQSGSYTISVVVSNSSSNATSSIPATVVQTLTTLSVAPTTANILINNTQQFTASGKDQFGASMLVAPAINWTISAGAGSIDSNGLYSATATPGMATVKATSGSINNTATVTINASQLMPTVSWFAPADITYGTLLSTLQLNATANAPGTFVYTPPLGTLLNSGTNVSLAVQFTPTDPVTYSSASANVTFNVLKKSLTAIANASTRMYGVANPAFTGTLAGVVAGDAITASYTSSATLTTSAGTYSSVSAEAITPVILDPNNKLSNYVASLTNAALTISKAAATITLSNLIQNYDGSAKSASFATVPPNLNVSLTYNGNVQSPIIEGSYAVLASINDINYSGTASGTLIIDRTVLTSAANAIPNPVIVLQPITFTASASNSNNDVLTYSWDFGDGLQGSGASAAHTYQSPGTFHAVVMIDNKLVTISSSVDVTVSAAVAVIGEGLDSDGDGFSDSFEAFAGTNPDNASATPTGQPISLNSVTGLILTKAQIKLNFVKAGSDSISFNGTVSIPQGLVISGAIVLLDAGGILKKFTLNSRGSAKIGGDSFKLKIKSRKGLILANPSAGFSAAFSKGSFTKILAQESQLTNTTLSRVPRTVAFSLLFNGVALKKLQNMSYSSKANKTGIAK